MSSLGERKIVPTADGIIPNPALPIRLNARNNPNAYHHSKIGEYLRNQREFGCDMELVCEGEKVGVYSVIAAAHSELFARALARNQPPFSLDLSGRVSKGGLRKALDFIYEGKVTVRAESIHQTLDDAIELGMPEFQAILESYIRQLAAHPHYFVLTLNAAFSLPASYHTKSYISGLVARRLKVLMNLPEFRQLSQEALCAVFGHPETGGQDSMDIFKGILIWIEASEDRQSHVDEMMDFVDFTEFSDNHKRDVLSILNQCPKVVREAVFPRLKEADWHRTCVAGGAPEHSNLPLSPTDVLVAMERQRAMEKETRKATENQYRKRLPISFGPEDSAEPETLSEVTPPASRRQEEGRNTKSGAARELFQRPSLSELDMISDFTCDNSRGWQPAENFEAIGTKAEIAESQYAFSELHRNQDEQEKGDRHPKEGCDPLTASFIPFWQKINDRTGG